MTPQDKLTQTERDDIDKRLIKLGYENFSKQELGAEITALKASLETAVAALEFYSTPSFLSRDNGKTWQELVQLIPHIYSEKFNPDIQREVEFGTVAREALAKIRKDGGV